MRITSLHLKNFRCFDEIKLDLSNEAILITGLNGSGKSSLLEALHYGCYLRSFRTHLSKELIKFDDKNFFIKIGMNNDDEAQTLSIGFSGAKRLVKMNQHTISSYKELTDYYRVITITEDDLSLVKGSPEGRRLFLDQAVSLHNPDYVKAMKLYRKILEQRNALLHKGTASDESYRLWTQQLFDQAILIQAERRAVLKKFAHSTQQLINRWLDGSVTMSFDYASKRIEEGETLEQFLENQPQLKEQELRFRRTLFGPHLDDITIAFGDKSSRTYASRGQQKLIVVLLKIAQIEHLQQGRAIILLDDFMTDFDLERAGILFEALKETGCQLVVTSPTKSSYFDELLLKSDSTCHIQLTN